MSRQGPYEKHLPKKSHKHTKYVYNMKWHNDTHFWKWREKNKLEPEVIEFEPEVVDLEPDVVEEPNVLNICEKKKRISDTFKDKTNIARMTWCM